MNYEPQFWFYYNRNGIRNLLTGNLVLSSTLVTRVEPMYDRNAYGRHERGVTAHVRSTTHTTLTIGLVRYSTAIPPTLTYKKKTTSV